VIRKLPRVQFGKCACLTLRWDIHLFFESGEHLQGEGLAFLPDINELSDFFLQDKKQSKWGFRGVESQRMYYSGGISSQDHVYLAAPTSSEDYRARMLGRTF
jgi:hypothetical protein